VCGDTVEVEELKEKLVVLLKPEKIIYKMERFVTDSLI